MSDGSKKAPARTKTVHCKSPACQRTAEVPAAPLPTEGHPWGWYYLTVQVPPWFNATSSRAYRAIGLFCSADCLGAYNGELQREEERHRHAYEHE